MELNNRFIDEKVYKKGFGDKEIIKEEFHEFMCNSTKTPSQILYLLYGNELTADEIAEKFPQTEVGTIKVTISRLNKNLKLKVVNKNNKINTYSLNRRGLTDLLYLVLEYTRTSEYVQDNKRDEIKNDRDLIKRFSYYFDEHKGKDLRRYAHEETDHLLISICDLSEYDFKLSDLVLDSPEEAISIIKTCIKHNYLNELDLPEDQIQIRFIDVPSTNQIHIGNRRTNHLGKFVQMTGIIKRKTTINPRITYLDYLCTNPSCNFSQDKLRVPQYSKDLKIIKNCPKCKSGVEEISKTKKDYQYILLEEDISVKDNVDTSVAKIKCVLLDELTSALNDKRNTVGSKVIMNGILKDEVIKKGNSQSTETTFYLEVNNLINSAELNEIKLEKEDIEEIKNFGNDPECFEKLKENFLPTIKGYDDLKESMLLQLFGGCEFGTKRNDMHILLIGDPGVGKSDMIKRVSEYAPKSIYAQGKASSKAGLTASVVKDELTGDFAVEAGAMALANGGLFACDELDKMSDEDTSSMHEGMEQQTITINKAGKAVLQCKCAMIAGANPLKSKFDDNLTIDQQVKFEPSLLSRFDIIAILKDKPLKARDSEIAKGILSQFVDDDNKEEYISPKFYKKFIYYVKHHKKLRMTESVFNYLHDEYLKRRALYDPQETKFSFGTRQLEGWSRLTFAIAKANFSDELKVDHAKNAIEIMDRFNQKLGFENINAIEKVSTDLQYISTTIIAQIKKIIINNLKQKKSTTHTELKKMFDDEKQLNSNLNKLKKEGIIIEHKKGIYTILGGNYK